MSGLNSRGLWGAREAGELRALGMAAGLACRGWDGGQVQCIALWLLLELTLRRRICVIQTFMSASGGSQCTHLPLYYRSSLKYIRKERLQSLQVSFVRIWGSETFDS